MFSLKKILAFFFSPLSVCVALIACGLLMQFFSQKQRTGKTLVSFGFILLIISSYEGVSGRILHTLESQYPPINLSRVVSHQTGKTAENSVKWIVVLTGGVAPPVRTTIHFTEFSAVFRLMRHNPRKINGGIL